MHTVRECLPVLSSRCFRVFCLSFKTLSHFEFTFVHSARVCCVFLDLHLALQFSQHHLLKRVSFSHFIFVPPWLKVNELQVSLLISVLSIVFHSSPCLFFFFLPVPHRLDYCSFEVLFTVWKSYASGCLLLLLLLFSLRFFVDHSQSLMVPREFSDHLF